MALLVITTLFGLSLLAAWILFKFLQSSASVSKPEYQLGGAVAGFVVILSLLSLTYIQVDSKRHEEQLTQLTASLAEAQNHAADGNACLARERTENVFSGTVSPSLEGANVVLVLGVTQLQSDGRFLIKSNRVAAADNPSIYVIGATSHAPYTQLMDHDDPRNLRISASAQ
jgi:hypothetical protein